MADSADAMVQFGRYLIERRLALGGMGEVSLARQRGPDGFERACVIKRMHRSLSLDADVVKLFLQEAQLTAQLSHPHIAQVYDFGKVDGVYYLAMERIDGPSLRELLSMAGGAPLPLPEACRIVADVAHALEFAHSASDAEGRPLGLVHRDVSPSNILVSKLGAVKLIDFGIAKSAAAAVRTREGSVRGKLGYMAPDALEGAQLDRRGDVFALGLVLYELCTGQAAVRGASESQLLSSLNRWQGVDVAQLPAAAPAALTEVITRATQRDPPARYPTAGAMAAALEGVLREQRWEAGPTQIAALATAALARPMLASDLESQETRALDPRAPEACPSEAELTRFAEGLLAGAAADRVRGHLDGCATCRQLAALLKADDDATTEPKSGERIGRYVIEGELGAGAMGMVLRARDPQLNRPVALKLLLDDGKNQGRRARLLRESQAAARVRHPNVVAVYDAGQHRDELFVAMELVEGTTLRDWVARRKPEPVELLRVLREIALGLHAIHEAGLVHRDIKPENILVDTTGHPRVTDFGLVRDSRSSELTRTGQVVGTPAYMAPEQLAGEEATAKSDQFAFCVVACEAITGKRPFNSPSVAAQRAAIAAGPQVGWARPWQVVGAVLERGLALPPEARFESMQQLLAALEPPPAAVRGNRARSLAVALGVGAAAVAGAAAALVLTGAYKGAPGPERQDEQTAPASAVPAPAATAGVADGPERASLPQPPPPVQAQPMNAGGGEKAAPVTRGQPPRPRPTGRRERVKAPAADSAATGVLLVESTPDLELSVDGKAVGRTPQLLKLANGTHRLSMRGGPSGPSHDQSVQIESGKETRVSWAPKRVRVEVRAAPPDVEFHLLVDGAPMGTTPMESFELWEGRHRLSITSSSGWSLEKSVELPPNAHTRLKLIDGVGVEVVGL